MGLNSPLKSNLTAVSFSEIDSKLHSKVKGNLSLAAPKITFENGVFSFIFNLISGIPFNPKIKAFSSKTSNFAMVSGISFSKFFTSDKALNKYSADF